uniref:Secreted protein n=1 Tax=Heterorhabditis bacteriophora TaxID=37862 RepID=A0A1I7XLJ2_HETBA
MKFTAAFFLMCLASLEAISIDQRYPLFNNFQTDGTTDVRASLGVVDGTSSGIGVPLPTMSVPLEVVDGTSGRRIISSSVAQQGLMSPYSMPYGNIPYNMPYFGYGNNMFFRTPYHLGYGLGIQNGYGNGNYGVNNFRPYQKL